MADAGQVRVCRRTGNLAASEGYGFGLGETERGVIDVTGRGTAAVDGRNGSDGAAPVYSYRPGLVGAGWEFRLQADGLAWQVGSASGIVRYQDIRRVRLSYRPVTQQHHRFLTEVWSSSGPKLRIFSTT